MDYEQLGLKCGLEIHQQLDTNKLFCECPSIIRDDQAHFKVKRVLRASAGETGEVDAAAAAESTKKKHFIYQGYHDTTCLVELDEEPPHSMNQEALHVVLQICKLFNSRVVDQIRVMRKTVIDGSNTTGFQRTSLVGLGGTVAGIGVETVCIEEDACKIVSRNTAYDEYNLSRLGIPLIEIATAPDIKSPEQAKQVAEEIGMILRSTGKAKRGIGTIRQDLNVSIAKGVRVEMKGVQELRLIPQYVEYEVLRQKNLVDIFAKLKKNKASADKKIYDLSALFVNSEGKVIQSALKTRGVVYAIKLPGYEGFLGKEIQPGRRLGSELSDYAKSQGVKGLFHSDELPKYGITQNEVDAVKKELKIKKGEAFILIADQKEIAQRSLETVIARANTLSLIKEVRQAKPDGTSVYLRPMPGSSRMYPETDVPAITPPSLETIELPELISDKAKRFEKEYKVSGDLAKQLAKNAYDFDMLVKTYAKLTPTFLADSLVNLPKDLKKRFGTEMDPEAYDAALKLVLDKLVASEISAQAVPDIMISIHKGESLDWSKYKPMDTKDLDKVIKEVIKEDLDAPIGALMGQVMKKLGGKADGKIVMQRLKELM